MPLLHYPRDRRIGVIGTLILAILTLSAGIGVYFVMQRQTERILSRTLDLTVAGNVRMFQRQVREWIANSVTIATRPLLMDKLSVWRRPGAHPRSRALLARAARSFRATGFSAVQFRDGAGHVLASSGRFVTDPQLRVRLSAGPHAVLLWDNGLVLHARVPMKQGGRVIGAVVTERRMGVLRAAFSQARTLGKSSELAVCGAHGKDMQCFPSNIYHRVLRHLAPSRNGHFLPMYYAIAGRSGTVLARDYRGVPVVAAYAPIGHTGLGMVLKIDQADLFRPVKRELKNVAILVALLMLVGSLLLEWTVTPLIRKLVLSERDARDAGDRLLESESRTRTILNSVSEGIITVDRDGVIETFNPAAEQIFGYRSDEAIGRSSNLLIPDLAGLSQGIRARTGESGAGTGHAREVTGVRRNGQRFALEVKVSAVRAEGRDLVIVLARDITERKETERRVLYLANHDPLTGLPNRVMLQARINQVLQDADRSSHHGAVLFIDLDHFKTINDSLGHDVGDLLLQAVAGRLRSAVRPGDTVARQGGDEFIVVLADVASASDAELVARHLQRLLSAPYRLAGHELRTTASIGISLFPDHGKDADTLLKSSDMAMYCAKASDRGSARLFDTQMNLRAAAAHDLKTDLHAALERDQLELFFQPIVSVADRGLVAVEALLRWRHP
ncbi:MAG TPA: diguanylate cyclase, partial [Acidiferrobacteraceae bacterium]|nr:diguanylate cyclase [Acidiferrobacteraceae bacterium]